MLKRTALHSLTWSDTTTPSVGPPSAVPASVPVTTPPPPVQASRSSISSEGSAYLRRGSEASNSSFQSFIFPSGPAQSEFARLTAESAGTRPPLPMPVPPPPVPRSVANLEMGMPVMELEEGLGQRNQGGAVQLQHRRMGPAFVESSEGMAYAGGLEAVRYDLQRQHQAPTTTTFEYNPCTFISPAAPSFLASGLLAAHLQPRPPAWPSNASGSAAMYADSDAAPPAGTGAFGAFGGAHVPVQDQAGPEIGYGTNVGGEGPMMELSSPRLGGMMGCFGELSAGAAGPGHAGAGESGGGGGF